MEILTLPSSLPFANNNDALQFCPTAVSAAVRLVWSAWLGIIAYLRFSGPCFSDSVKKMGIFIIKCVGCGETLTVLRSKWFVALGFLLLAQGNELSDEWRRAQFEKTPEKEVSFERNSHGFLFSDTNKKVYRGNLQVPRVETQAWGISKDELGKMIALNKKTSISHLERKIESSWWRNLRSLERPNFTSMCFTSNCSPGVISPMTLTLWFSGPKEIRLRER